MYLGKGPLLRECPLFREFFAICLKVSTAVGMEGLQATV